MMLFWILMSGKFDTFHLVLGAISSLIVAWSSTDLLFQDRGKSPAARASEAGRFVLYACWLFWQIVLANFHVIYLSLTPKPIKETLSPHIFNFKTTLKTDFARFVLANSITLTPGTVTIRVSEDIFVVHAITVKAAGDLEGGSISEMERRVAWVFEKREIGGA
ncbi:MAG: Na+/H+ antiporter subunit E [Desulfobulbaceae bacterium]|nr:Na+/H+ antiporter subunit E [Desulfobulbaceae bacterium]